MVNQGQHLIPTHPIIAILKDGFFEKPVQKTDKMYLP